MRFSMARVAWRNTSVRRRAKGVQRNANLSHVTWKPVNHLHVPELRLEIGVSVDGGRHGAHEPVTHWVHALKYGAGPGEEHHDESWKNFNLMDLHLLAGPIDMCIHKV
jgi:hypothetical protein